MPRLTGVIMKVDLSSYNHFHDSTIISLRIDCISFVNDSYISKTNDFIDIETIIQIHSLKEKPIIKITFIGCSKFTFSQNISELIDEMSIESSNNIFQVKISENITIECKAINWN